MIRTFRFHYYFLARFFSSMCKKFRGFCNVLDCDEQVNCRSQLSKEIARVIILLEGSSLIESSLYVLVMRAYPSRRWLSVNSIIKTLTAKYLVSKLSIISPTQLVFALRFLDAHASRHQVELAVSATVIQIMRPTAWSRLKRAPAAKLSSKLYDSGTPSNSFLHLAFISSMDPLTIVKTANCRCPS